MNFWNRYREKRFLNGLIYLHRITDIRFDSGASTTLGIFRKIYGNSGYEKLALVTTMWNDVEDVNKPTYEAKEEELKNNIWGTFLHRRDQALVARYNCTTSELGQKTAQQTVADLLHHTIKDSTIKLQLQKELVEDRVALPRTAAGRATFTLTETARYYLRQISE